MAGSIEKFCTRCGTVGVPASDGLDMAAIALPIVGAAAFAALLRTRSRRGWWMPLVLVAPRVVMEVARSRRERVERCSACNSTHVIPLDTPFAQEHLKKPRVDVS